MKMREILAIVEAAQLQDIRDRDGFEMWFEGSKVVDDQGNPLRVYHGTTADFDTFGGEDIAYRGGIIAFFSTSPKFASDYATQNTGANVKACYLRCTKPFDFRKDGERMARYFYDDTGGINDPYEINRILSGLGQDVQMDDRDTELTEEQFVGAVRSGSWDAIEAPEFVEYLREYDYDAVVLLENGAINFGIFDPRQVKSAFARSFDRGDARFDESAVLNEFDLRKPIIWIAQDRMEWRGTFKAGGQDYLVVLQNVKQPVPNAFMAASGVRIDFGAMVLGTDTNASLYDLGHALVDTNTGQQRFSARTVYSYAMSAALEYMRVRKPAFVLVGGREGEKAEIYKTMARFLQPTMAKEGYSGLRVQGEWITFWQDRFKIANK